MELHQLRYFSAVAEFGSFTRAAEHCLVSQPSLSQQIAKLEGELGQQLFERLGKKVLLTDSGRALYARVADILTSIEDAVREVKDADSDRGSIVVGAIPTVAPYLLPPVLESFVREYPNAEVTFNEDVTARLIHACLRGEIDVAVLALPINDPQIHVEPILREELYLALPPNHPLTKKPKVTMDDIANEPFILLHEAHCLGEQIIRFCEQHSCKPIARCRSAQLLTVQSLVSLGHGVSLIPEMARKLDRTGMCVYRSLSGYVPTRVLAVGWHVHRYQSPLTKKFIETIRRFGRLHSIANGHEEPSNPPPGKRPTKRMATKVKD